MPLTGKLASEVTIDDIKQLVRDQVEEDQTLDFKREPYGRSAGQRKEMLRDIVAMANASGGYIVIGIDEDDEGRATAIRPVEDARQVRDDMSRSIVEGIGPRAATEVECVSCEGGHVIVVRVPESGIGPHMVKFSNRTHFVRRYNREKREMSVEEIRAAFQGDETLRRLARVEEMLQSLQREATAVQLSEIGPETPIDMLQDVASVRYATRVRAQERVGDDPFYRATITPDCVEERISFGDVRPLLRRPPATRNAGWHIWDLELSESQEGILGKSHRGQEVLLLRNGHMEFRQPARDDGTYQWRQSATESRDHPWIYPYALIELPVSFFRLARQVYETVGLTCHGIADHGFWNIQGFVLYRGHPQNAFFGLDGKVYQGDSYRSEELEIADVSSFDADELVFRLIRDFYASFGHEESAIPLFDEDSHFQP